MEDEKRENSEPHHLNYQAPIPRSQMASVVQLFHGGALTCVGIFAAVLVGEKFKSGAALYCAFAIVFLALIVFAVHLKRTNQQIKAMGIVITMAMFLLLSGLCYFNLINVVPIHPIHPMPAVAPSPTTRGP